MAEGRRLRVVYSSNDLLTAALTTHETYGGNIVFGGIREDGSAWYEPWRNGEVDLLTKGARDSTATRLALQKTHKLAWMVTGSCDVGVMDFDGEEMQAIVREDGDPELTEWFANSTAVECGKADRIHVYGRKPTDIECHDRSGDGWDLRVFGLVAIPGSPHRNRDATYKYVDGRGPEALMDFPARLFELTAKLKRGGVSDTESGRSREVDLLNDPPTGDTGRNTWFTALAGHRVGRFEFQDGFEADLLALNRGLECPYPEDGVLKIARFRWEREHAEETGGPTEESGWLVNGQDCVQGLCGKDEDEELKVYLNASIKATGKLLDANGELEFYELEVSRSGDTRTVKIRPSVLHDNRSRDVWFTKQQIIELLSNQRDIRGQLSKGMRLTRFFESQNPPVKRSAEWYGWHDDLNGYVTPLGLVTADGVKEGVTGPDESSYLYKEPVSRNELRACFRELATYHHPETAAVVLAWHCSVLVLDLLRTQLGQHPILAVEAPSESAKTNGLLGLAAKLTGWSVPGGTTTAAALNDALADHANGAVIVDDEDNLQHVMDLLRGAASGGSRRKKDPRTGFSTTVEVKYRATIRVAGESLPFTHEKAMADRSLVLHPESPTERMSLHNPKRKQWDDIRKFQQENDLHAIATTLLIETCKLRDQISSVIDELDDGNGRVASNLTALKVGGWLLRQFIGQDRGQEDTTWVEEKLDAYCAGVLETYDATDNVLRSAYVPEFLNQCGKVFAYDTERKENVVAQWAYGSKHYKTPPVAVFDGKGRMWFSPAHMASWLRETRYPDLRLADQNSLIEQAKRMGWGGKRGVGRKNFFKANLPGMYWLVPDEQAEKLCDLCGLE